MYLVYIKKEGNFKIEIKELTEDFYEENLVYCEYHLSENIAKSRKEFLEKLSKLELEKMSK